MKPKIVEEWEESVRMIEGMVPKCCWTCCEFSENGKSCLAHGGSVVPDEFSEKVDQCDSWNRMPF